MATTKVNLKNLYTFIQNAPRTTGAAASRAVAATLREKALDLVSKGVSPIAGRGRFAAYLPREKNKRYPESAKNDYPAKRRRPVNLELSGKFLKSLRSFVSRVNVITFGFTSEYGKTLEQGHREGANGQAERPIVPGPGEEFAPSIKLAMLKTYRDYLQAYLNKK